MGTGLAKKAVNPWWFGEIQFPEKIAGGVKTAA
jgi:hypothetical protein